MSITARLFRAARLSADARALTSGNPHRIARRAKNKLIGHTIGHAGIWARLWR